MKKTAVILFLFFLLTTDIVLAASLSPQKSFIPKTGSTNIFSRQTNKLLPEPQASLLAGILWGEEKSMPKDFYEALRKTGTLHVIALSGMNITILANLIARITLWMGRRRAVLISLISIVIFIWFVGASASIIRAGIMGGLSLIAVFFGRKSWAVLSLFLAAGIMLIINPAWIFNLGFQLSFLATLGIIILGNNRYSEFSPLALSERSESKGHPERSGCHPEASAEGSHEFTGKPMGFFANAQNDNIQKSKFSLFWSDLSFSLKTNLQITLAAQIFTMPIILYNFKQLSLIAPLTNVLVLWIVQPIMVLGLMLSLLAISYAPLAIPLSWVLWVPLTYFIEVVKLTASFPLASINF